MALRKYRAQLRDIAWWGASWLRPCPALLLVRRRTLQGGGRRGLFPLPAARRRRRSVLAHATLALAGAFLTAMARLPGRSRSCRSRSIRSSRFSRPIFLYFRRRTSASARAALMPWRRKASAQLTAKLHCTLEQKGIGSSTNFDRSAYANMYTSTSIHFHTPTQHQHSNQWTMYERE